MKTIYLLLVSLLLDACNRPQIEVELPQTSTNHLMAFSRDSLPAPSGVRLKAVLWNGQRFLEYVYSNGYLTEEIRYATDRGALFLSSSHYERTRQGLSKIVTHGRDYNEGGPGIDTTLNKGVKTIVRRSDLVVDFTDAPDFTAGFSQYKFTTMGSLLSSDDSYVKTTYEVDSRNNINLIRSRLSMGSVTYTTTLTYDTHPNPYRTTGRLGYYRFDAFETDYSPDNVVSKTFTNPELNFTKTITYDYTYRSDGYPTQVTIQDSSDPNYKPTYRFIYSK